MTREELIRKVGELLPQKIAELNSESSDVIVVVEVANILEILKQFKESGEFAFDYLMCLSGVDYPPDRVELVYHLFSLEKNHRICVKTHLARENPVAPSAVHIWNAAEWHEREIYDLLGVKFEGHPDLRRILLPEDFVGHPLRKDYEDPEVIHFPDSKEMMKPAKKV